MACKHRLQSAKTISLNAQNENVFYMDYQQKLSVSCELLKKFKQSYLQFMQFVLK